MTRPKESAGVIVIGAGIAGLATAYHLTRLGVSDVLVLEREPVPGAHASGRNAGMFRMICSRASIAELVRRSAAQFAEEEWSTQLVRRTGSLTLSGDGALGRLEAHARATRAAGVAVIATSGRDAALRVPALASERIQGALFSPDDGTLDVHALILGLVQQIRARGGRVQTSCGVERVVAEDGRIQAVVTEGDRRIECRIVVNAAGAWASQVGESAGALAVPLQPCRRHLVFLDNIPNFDRSWPSVWDLSSPVYFRPELGGLLASPCDEEPTGALSLAVDSNAVATAVFRAQEVAPPLAQARVRQSWVCLRTLTPDREFVVGPDPIARGLYWVAGLGGHGMSAGLEVGRLAALTVLGKTEGIAPWMSPTRFASGERV